VHLFFGSQDNELELRSALPVRYVESIFMEVKRAPGLLGFQPF